MGRKLAVSENEIQTESATLLESGEIDVVVVTGDGDVVGHGGFILKPGDGEYAEYKARFGLEKCGDSKTIERQLVDGVLVDLLPRVRANIDVDPTEGMRD
ncbi:MAG: hypothetical protein R3D26_16760 [Cyanobacteriota/Melainabacteria group bacterium]